MAHLCFWAVSLHDQESHFSFLQGVHALAYLCAAESREESLLLAKQLAAAKADLQKVKASSSKLSRQLETEQILRTDAEGAAEALKQRLEKLLNGSKEANKHRTDMAEVRKAAVAALQRLP
jgi:translation initiation factor IF-2